MPTRTHRARRPRPTSVPPLPQLRLRSATPADAPALADLSRQLGYPITAPAIVRYLHHRSSREERILVAVAARTVVGFVHVRRIQLLIAPAYAEIEGLVVDARHRGCGAGRALMTAAEAWAMRHGLPLVRLRSHVRRRGAHRFYTHLGYARIRTSYTFQKALTALPTRRGAGRSVRGSDRRAPPRA